MAGYDLDEPIPPRPGPSRPAPARTPTGSPTTPVPSPRPGRLALAATLALCALHSWAIWSGMGGPEQIGGAWPVLRDDHGIHYHDALMARDFLRSSGRTAGYDPYFMAGFANSSISNLSDAPAKLAVAAFGGDRPAAAYNYQVWAACASPPWLIAWACAAWRLGRGATAWATGLFLVYIWTDFPMNFAGFGMTSYLMVIPLALVDAAAIAAFLEAGGPGRWLAAAVLSALVVLVHPLAGMIVPASAILAYGAACRGGIGVGRHAGFWAIAPAAALANAPAWLPMIPLWSTKGDTAITFTHSDESVWLRLGQILTQAPPAEAVLIGFGLAGLWSLARSGRVRGAALAGFAGAGFAWGYLAGFSKALDVLQPGRHTYAFYSALSIAAGYAAAEALSRIHGRGDGLASWVGAGVLLVGARFFGPAIVPAASYWSSPATSPLSCRPTARQVWLVDRLKQRFRPGSRIFYEEAGKSVGVPDPFEGRKLSGAIPGLAGLELVGGPYLHVPVKANFTQFGEGALCGKAPWSPEDFDRYARIYRPEGIVCWTPRARAYCRSHPERVEVLDDDGAVLIGRVLGFEGAASVGSAEVTASANRLTVRPGTPGVDGTIVLTYHSVPNLRSRPPARWDAVYLEDDPVPFLRLRPAPGAATLELELAP